MDFPELSGHTLDVNESVAFLKYVADQALSTIPADGLLERTNPFAAAIGDHRGVPLSCKFDGEAIHPDPLVLLLAGFSDAEEPKAEEARVGLVSHHTNRAALAMRGMILFKYNVISEESNVRKYG